MTKKREEEICLWISDLAQNEISSDNLISSLRNGQILCQLANAIDKNCITEIGEKKTSYHAKKNIEKFLVWVQDFIGIGDDDLFTIDQLQWDDDAKAVFHTLDILYEHVGTLSAQGQKQLSLDRKEKTDSPKTSSKLAAFMSSTTQPINKQYKDSSIDSSPSIPTESPPQSPPPSPTITKTKRSPHNRSTRQRRNNDKREIISSVPSKRQNKPRHERNPRHSQEKFDSPDEVDESSKMKPSTKNLEESPRYLLNDKKNSSRLQDFLSVTSPRIEDDDMNKYGAIIQPNSIEKIENDFEEPITPKEEEKLTDFSQQKKEDEEKINHLNHSTQYRPSDPSPRSSKSSDKKIMSLSFGESSDSDESDEYHRDKKINMDVRNPKILSTHENKRQALEKEKDYDEYDQYEDDVIEDEKEENEIEYVRSRRDNSAKNQSNPKSKIQAFLQNNGNRSGLEINLPSSDTEEESHNHMDENKEVEKDDEEEIDDQPIQRKSPVLKSKTIQNLFNSSDLHESKYKPKKRPKGPEFNDFICYKKKTNQNPSSKLKKKDKFSLETKRKNYLQDQLITHESKFKDIQKKNKKENIENKENNKIRIVQGICCYVPDPEEMWIKVEVESYDARNKKVHVIVNAGKENESTKVIDLMDPKVIEAIGGPTAKEVDSLPPAFVSDSPNGEDDMQYLKYLNEPSILFNLIDRFNSTNPYTYTNDIVIAVNPYKWLNNLYGEDLHEKYANASREELPPHVYATSSKAYKNMKNYQESQSILVSGESGAGKTETSKILMNHIASIAGGRNDSTISKVIDVNPLLESFGNAKTIRNDNSSRFGKFTQLQFDCTGKLIGAKCETYLLEKSRVVSMDEGERNYHIFYQMLAGLSNEDLEDVQLDPDHDYLYCGLLDNMQIDGLNDAEKFDRTRDSLQLIGIDDNLQMLLFQILSGILHLGELEFEECDEEEEASQVSNLMQLNVVGKLLELPEEYIEECCCERTVRARDEEYKVPLSVKEAAQNRDALAKSIYSKIFNWLVERINDSLAADETKTKNQIGVLDIFGFEDFHLNSFEQFCINYANEKLQQKFTLDVFKTVQEEYVEENIVWDHIEFKDNQHILDMIEGRMGIIAMLNDHIRQPKGTEEALVNKIKIEFSKPDKAEQFACLEFPKRERSQFTIRHYAGCVTYETIGFMEKQQDVLQADLFNLVKSSEMKFLCDLFDLKINSKSTKSLVHKNSSIAQETLSTQFKNSLNSLMSSIGNTMVHYIRCIKPNASKSSEYIDQRMVVEQLRSAGVIEAIRISRSGYPSRLSPKDFYQRYGIMFPPSLQGKDQASNCHAVMKACGKKSPDDYQMGKTKVYLKSGLIEDLEVIKSDFIYIEATCIQKIVLGYLQRKSYKKRYNEMMMAAITIQKYVRRWIHQRYFDYEKQACISIQAALRGYIGRVRMIQLRKELEEEKRRREERKRREVEEEAERKRKQLEKEKERSKIAQKREEEKVKRKQEREKEKSKRKKHDEDPEFVYQSAGSSPREENAVVSPGISKFQDMSTEKDTKSFLERLRGRSREKSDDGLQKENTICDKEYSANMFKRAHNSMMDKLDQFTHPKESTTMILKKETHGLRQQIQSLRNELQSIKDEYQKQHGK